MQQRGLPKTYLTDGCGLFWINVDGRAEKARPSGRINRAEVQATVQLVAALTKHLARTGLEATIGVVTPYRSQKELLGEVLAKYPNIKVGTAHTFQGDERDIMIFSLVLSEGIEQSIDWLNRTVNLLNVALTRARNTLFIVGNWAFCNRLADGSKYKALADYALNIGAPIVGSLNELTFFGDTTGQKPRGAEQETSHRVTLRRWIAEAQDYVWWLDASMTIQTLYLLHELVSHPDTTVRELRLMTTTARVGDAAADGGLNLDVLYAVRAALHKHGISLKLGAAENLALENPSMFSRGYAHVVPSLNNLQPDRIFVSDVGVSLSSVRFEAQWRECTLVT
ncbi:MAG: hypothetical protein HC828_19970 [Blastochloris sp.]|nr:hypothetical protein [Blastochloris sp.]